jgi:hypothetical protein
MPPRTKDAGHDITHDESLRVIIRIARLYEGDFASAEGIRESLLSLGALRRETDEHGQIWIVKADTFPEQELTVDAYMAREQGVVDAIHRRDVGMIEEDRRNRAAVARQLAVPSMADQITQFVDKLVAERLPEVVREAVERTVPAAVKQAMQEHTTDTVDAVDATGGQTTTSTKRRWPRLGRDPQTT